MFSNCDLCVVFAWPGRCQGKCERKRYETETRRRRRKKRCVAPNMMMYAHCKYKRRSCGNGKILIYGYFRRKKEIKLKRERKVNCVPCAVCTVQQQQHQYAVSSFSLCISCSHNSKFKPNSAGRPTIICEREIMIFRDPTQKKATHSLTRSFVRVASAASSSVAGCESAHIALTAVEQQL